MEYRHHWHYRRRVARMAQGIHTIDLPSGREYLRVTPDPLVDERAADVNRPAAMSRLPDGLSSGE